MTQKTAVSQTLKVQLIIGLITRSIGGTERLENGEQVVCVCKNMEESAGKKVEDLVT